MQAPGVSYDAAEDRRLIGAMSTPGVISGFAIAAGVGLTVSVSAGVAILSDGLGGCYLAYFDQVTTVPVGASATSTLYVLVNPTTGQSTIVSAAPGTTPAGARLVIGSAVTSTTGVTAVSTTGRVYADSPGQPSAKYLASTGGTVSGVINAQKGVRLGGVNATARHYARAYRTTIQAVATATWTGLRMDVADRRVSDYGVSTFGTPALPAGSRFYAGVPGSYQLTGSAFFDTTSSAGTRRSRIVRYDATEAQLWTKHCDRHAGDDGGQVWFDGLVDADAGDYFELQVYQDSGAVLNLSAPAGVSSGFMPWGAMRLVQAD